MKRAKYVGPHDAVEVWPHGYTGPSILVEQGHLLPSDVPATFRDSLLEQEDAWTEVDQATGPKKGE